jgi:hypothetical protein
MSSRGSAGPNQLTPHRFSSAAVDRVARKVRRVFARLDSRPYLGVDERREFRFYQGLFDESLARLDRKVQEGRTTPVDLTGFPQVLNYRGYSPCVGIFIGSFDPFQMTHLGAALRFLGSDESDADLVFVVPEGKDNPLKPKKSDYNFRYELLRLQIESIFAPFVVPLDIGRGADTIGIVERLIDLHPGAHLKLTHVLGSDSLPVAASLLAEDLAAWRARAALRHVELDHGMHIELRRENDPIEPYAEAVAALGSRFAVDRRFVGAPSSTDFRSGRNLTIVFPTDAVLSRLELLFRYGMNRSWMPEMGEDSAEGADGAGSANGAGAPRSSDFEI